MTEYVVTTHDHLEGARLSKRGHWGNIPFASVDDAIDAARADAKKDVLVEVTHYTDRRRARHPE